MAAEDGSLVFVHECAHSETVPIAQIPDSKTEFFSWKPAAEMFFDLTNF